MWVLTGNVYNKPEDPVDGLAAETSHWLRPGRTYRLGRMGGFVGKTASAPSKARLNDFNLKSFSISKEGVWELAAGGVGEEGKGGWQVLDDPNSPTNLDPYPLTLSIRKAVVLERDGQRLDLPAGTIKHEVQSGDRYTLPPLQNSMRLEWVPVILCFATAGPAKKKEIQERAKPLGIKVAYKNFLPHHTHYLLKTILPNYSLLLAAMSISHLVSPAYFDALLLHAQPPPYPTHAIPDHPGPPPQTIAGATADETKAQLAKYEKELTKWERSMLKLEPDVGHDWLKWWGRSIMEADWTKRPDERSFPCEPHTDYAQFTTEAWTRNERRRTMFEGVLAVSYREEFENDQYDQGYFELGGGHFMTSNLLRPGVALQTLLREIEDFKESKHIVDPVKFVLIAPENCEIQSQEGEHPCAGVMKELAMALGVGKLGISFAQDLVQAIFEAEAAPLFGPPLAPAPAANAEAGPSKSNTLKGKSLAPSQNILPFPSSGVPGTHPEESIRARDVVATNGGGAVAGLSGTNGGQEESSVVVARPLKRRARTETRDIASMFEDDEPASSFRGGLRTQDPAPSLDSSYPATMDVDDGAFFPPAAARAPARAGTRGLKRRADSQRQPSSSLFDDPGPAESESRASKKTRQERMKEIEDEDNAAAAAAIEAAKARKNGGRLADVEEEDEDAVPVARPSKLTRSKRGASELMEESEEETGGGAKLTTSKAAASKATTNKMATPARKRLRSTSAQPDEMDDEPIPVVVQKKEKVVRASAPKGKKAEVAAKKKEKEAKEREEAHLLRMKTIKRKTKGADVDQAFNEDFNALKIVRPMLKPMRAPEKKRMGWDEVDDEEERLRLIREDQDQVDHPDDWAGKHTQMFVIHTTQLVRKERPAPRNDFELEAKYAGRPNFKRFRPKNSTEPRPAREARLQPELVVPKPADFGLGTAYQENRKLTLANVTDDSDMEDDQPTLNFKTARRPATKSKGKGKQVIADSDEDLGNTMRGDEDMDMDSDSPRASNRKSKAKVKAPPTKKKAVVPPAKKATTVRKAAPQTIMIDDSDSSDDGLTFKGFGNKGAAGTKRKR